MPHPLQAKKEDTLDLCRLLNDDLAATVAKHPTRFVGLGTLPMQAPDLAVKELERCVKVLNNNVSVFVNESTIYFLSCVMYKQELGFPGVQIGSHINEWNMDAPELQSVFAVGIVCTCLAHRK